MTDPATPMTPATIVNAIGAVREEIAAASKRSQHARQHEAANAYINSDSTKEASIVAEYQRAQYLQDALVGLKKLGNRLGLVFADGD